jgi:hypothetical protein
MNLFYGDNDTHEFWESQNSETLIIRNRTEDVWIVMKLNGLMMPTDKRRLAQLRPSVAAQSSPMLNDRDLRALVRRVAHQYQASLVLDKSRRWAWTQNRKRMELQPAARVRQALGSDTMTLRRST